MDENGLIFDWNSAGPHPDWASVRVQLNDETLRDGLQCPSVRNPDIDVKKRLIHLMVDLGIASADIGLPGGGARAAEDTLALALEISRQKLPIAANCAARTLKADIEPIARISQQAGLHLEAATFIGSSPIRLYAEDWTLDHLLRATEESVGFAVKEGLSVMFVTEDTTRAAPDTLRRLYATAISFGARRICLADTVGHATPDGVRALVRFVREEIIVASGEDVKLDWHGHRDRGMGLANCMAALEAGVDCLHGTALGIGERVGNAEMDLLLINLKLLGAHNHDLTRLSEYVHLVSEACAVPIPISYPVFGEDAFRTGTGVHAAAIIKARRKGHDWLADRIYSGVPAGDFGMRQRIEISPVSGLSNVRYWLDEHGLDGENEDLCKRIFEKAKLADRALTETEIMALVNGS
jgi:2-isopropylmalate synthase